MFKWRKLGLVFNPLDVKNRDWLNEFAQAPCAVVFDSFVRVYFSCRPAPDRNGQYLSYSAYVDFDRKDLFKIINISNDPILVLGKKGTFDEFGTYPVSIIRNEKKLIAYYGGWTRCESVPFNVAIGMAESLDDGKFFAKMGDGPVLSYSPDEPFILSGPKIRKFNGQWILFYIAGKKWIYNENHPEPVYKIRMATSNDGINWVKHNKDLIQSKLEDDEAQASPDVFFYDNMYHMFFCYRYSLNFRSKEKGYRIGYAYSSDLRNWVRDDEQVGINVSEFGWDSEMISYPNLVELDGKIFMFYLGNDVGRFGFGVAELVK